jgi:hypothetical protein
MKHKIDIFFTIIYILSKYIGYLIGFFAYCFAALAIIGSVLVLFSRKFDIDNLINTIIIIIVSLPFFMTYIIRIINKIAELNKENLFNRKSDRRNIALYNLVFNDISKRNQIPQMGIALLLISYILLNDNFDYWVVAILAVFLTLSALDRGAMWLRLKHHAYGDNALELLEVAEFLTRHKQSGGDSNGPIRRLYSDETEYRPEPAWSVEPGVPKPKA